MDRAFLDTAELSLYAPCDPIRIMLVELYRELFLFILGLLLLNKGSDVFIESAKSIATRIKISTFIMGFFMVAFATSIPEIASTAYASYRNADGIAIGNILGSNVTNIALIFAIAILFREVRTTKKEKRSALEHLLITIISALAIISGNVISRLEGLILILMFLLYFYIEMKRERRKNRMELCNLNKTKLYFLTFFLGAAVVIFGSMLLVSSAVSIASILGVPQSIIGLTAVALGTSLPELATALTAMRKSYYEMAVGELIGSNVTNILFAIGLASIISPVSVDVPSLMGGLINVILISILLVLMSSREKFRGLEGVMLLLIYLEFLWVTYTFI